MTKTKTLNIFGAPWKIQEKPANKICETDPINGAVILENNLILIDENMSPNRKGLTLTHELLHVLMDYVGGPMSYEEEEKFISRVEHAVYELIRKFPEEYK